MWNAYMSKCSSRWYKFTGCHLFVCLGNSSWSSDIYEEGREASNVLVTQLCSNQKLCKLKSDSFFSSIELRSTLSLVHALTHCLVTDLS